MNDQKLRSLITTALRLDRGIEQAEARLRDLKAQIATEARLRPALATGTHGGGASILLEGGAGCIARVTETGRVLRAALRPEDRGFARIREASGACFARLFTPEIVHAPVPKFRDQARELLGDVAAKKLIRLCETPGKTTVTFEARKAAPVQPLPQPHVQPMAAAA